MRSGAPIVSELRENARCLFGSSNWKLRVLVIDRLTGGFQWVLPVSL
jgi:hypothetical protein